MPHASVTLIPGANTNETFALNEAGVSSCNLIRYMFDPKLGALIQKLGGWTKFFGNTTPDVVRALWAWADTQAISHLAYGTENLTGAQLAVITNGSLLDITPRYLTQSDAPVISTTAGSSIVTITDTVVTSVSNYMSVYIATPISIGGLILFGQYACNPDGYSGTVTYHIQATDILGQPVAATSSSTSPVLPEFSVTSGDPTVTVTLPAHGYAVGATFPVLISTTVGGSPLYGNYIVQTVVDADNFTITATVTPTSTATGFLNGGNAYYIYSYGYGSTSAGTGYGTGGYGLGGYGIGGGGSSPLVGDPMPASDWSLDNWGETLVACPIDPITPAYQPILQWNPTAGTPIAYAIPQAPVVNDSIFVAMPQRQIVALQSSFTGIQDPLLIRWCDVNNYNSWLASPINQAGSFRLPRGSKIIGGMQGPQQGLIWTDLAIWSMMYIGPPYVYSFNELGTGCGLIGRKAAASLSGIVYWMGPSQFYALSGDGVQPLPCPVWDVIFQNLDRDNVSRIRAAVNSRFGEVMWFYPTTTSNGEVAAYIKYNAFFNSWDFGELGRSAWIDQSVLGPPIGADPATLYLYQHETTPDADGQPLVASFQTGYYAMDEADLIQFVDQVWPDMKFGTYGGTQNATINMTFYVVNYPGETPRTYGPYAVTQSSKFISPRFRGRLVSIGIESNDIGSFWRLGKIRYRLQPDGKF